MPGNEDSRPALRLLHWRRIVRRRHVITFLVWLAILNSPPILVWVPFFRLLFFLPALFWINIPALWLGLADAMGRRHFDIQEFGAMPLTPLSWIAIAAFWSVLAAILAAITSVFQGLLCRGGHEERTDA